jgi:ABC-2 type transport system permease protein
MPFDSTARIGLNLLRDTMYRVLVRRCECVALGNLPQARQLITPDQKRLYCVNMGVTILLATAAAVVGRSVTFGLSAALVFFPIDNIAAVVMTLAFRITHNDFWLSATAYFLGPNLNIMAPALTSNRVESIGSTPLYFVEQAGQAHGILVDGTHTLVVALVYAVIFAVTAIVLTWKRDVKE